MTVVCTGPFMKEICSEGGEEIKELPDFAEKNIQRSGKVSAPGLVNFITAVAYHFCPSLPAAFTQPVTPTLAGLCRPCLKRGPPSVGDAGNRRVVRAWAFSVTSRHVRFICSCAKLHR